MNLDKTFAADNKAPEKSDSKISQLAVIAEAVVHDPPKVHSETNKFLSNAPVSVLAAAV